MLKYRLVHLTGGLAGRVHDMDAEELVLGRDPQAAQVVFPPEDGTVSRRHAVLRMHHGRLLVRDLSIHGLAFYLNPWLSPIPPAAQ